MQEWEFRSMLFASRKGVRVSLILGLCAAAVLLPAAAQARVFIGLGLPLPLYAPPPVYYAPPPVYYPPPVAYSPPPAYGSVPGYGGDYGGICYAGAYTCAAPPNAPAGSPCSCPGIGAPSYGTVR
jgi:hypothetical protein